MSMTMLNLNTINGIQQQKIEIQKIKSSAVTDKPHRSFTSVLLQMFALSLPI